jgi:spore coat protein CotF
MKTETKYAAPPKTHKELRAVLNASIKRAKAMSPEQLFETMVRAGIYTRHGRLRKEYGG